MDLNDELKLLNKGFVMDEDEGLLRDLRDEARRRGFYVLTVSKGEAILYAVFVLGIMYGLALR